MYKIFKLYQLPNVNQKGLYMQKIQSKTSVKERFTLLCLKFGLQNYFVKWSKTN